MDTAIEVVLKPAKKFVYDTIKEYVSYIRRYDENIADLVKKLEVICSKKQDIEDKVAEGKEKLEKVTKEAKLWLDRVHELSQNEELKKLYLREDKVAALALKLMKEKDLKELMTKDVEVQGLLLKVVKKEEKELKEHLRMDTEVEGLLSKTVIEEGDLEELLRKDSELKGLLLELVRKHREIEEKDLKELLRKDSKVRELLLKEVKEHKERKGKELKERLRKGNETVTRIEKVMKDASEEFKKLMKDDIEMAVVAVSLLKKEDLVKLRKDDAEMEAILERAQELCKSAVSDEENLNGVKNTFGKAVEKLRIPLQTMTGNDNFMNALPENVRFGVELMDGLSKADGFKHEFTKKHRNSSCYCFAVPFLYYYHRYEISKAAEALANFINDYIIDIIPKDSVTVSVRAGDLVPVPSEFLKTLESREKKLKEILNKLQDDDVNAVGVFGMGGAGKTVLAKEVVSNRDEISFETIVMAEISETPNIAQIQDQISEGLGLRLGDVHSLRQRAVMLYNRLKKGVVKNEGEEEERNKEVGKNTKTLIILDNMWQKLNLGEIGIPCESTGDLCCKFMVTSREESVCQMMGIKDSCIFPLGMLSETESKELFQYHVGKRIREEDYQFTMERLLKKCGGLPLTIVTTASALKGKDLPIWRHFADELEKPISSQVRGVHHQTYSILETSYKVMESKEKKMFFLLVCLSPFGSGISIENLMRYAVGLGLIQHVNKLSEAKQQASKWATELISSSMLLEGDSESHVKIHDVVRASAISFAAKESHLLLVEVVPRWIWEETFDKYTAISLLSGHGHNFSCLNGVKAKMLQILLLKGELSKSSELDGCFFQGMTNLKVLHLSHMGMEPKLPESIRDLKNLKTLHLEWCKLGDISTICELTKLLVLSLRYSVLEELPVNMENLVNLRILDMEGCRVNLNRTPTNTNVIASLCFLEGLYLFDNFEEWVNKTTSGSMADLWHLNILEDLRYLNVLEGHVPNPGQLPTAHVAKNLDMFDICVGETHNYNTYFDKFGPSCRELEIGKFPELDKALKVSCLEVLLKRADCLRLFGTEVKNSLVPELDIEGFRDLKYLEVRYVTCMECLVDTYELNGMVAFQKLEHLRLLSLHGLKIICKGKTPQGIFSNLRHLDLLFLNGLQYALPLDLLPHNLTSINITRCDIMKVIFNENEFVSSEGEIQEHIESKVIELPSLKSVEIRKAFHLVSMLGQAEMFTESHTRLIGQASFDKKIICPSLELLRLLHCYRIINLWSKEFQYSRFPNLKVIDIIGCRELQRLGSPYVFSTLQQLESLSIITCKRLQEVITKETNSEIPEKTIKFPQLKELRLKSSNNLVSFYQGSYKLEFPKLKTLKLSQLSELNTFVSEDAVALFNEKVKFSRLEELKVINVKATHLWNRHSSSGEDAPNLRKVTCDNVNWLGMIQFENISILKLHGNVNSQNTKVLFSTSESSANKVFHLSNLEILSVKNFENLKTLFEYKGNALVKNLSHLKLDNLPKLNLIPYHIFKNLRSLHISNLKWTHVFPSVNVVRDLEMLEDIRFQACNNIEVIIQDEEEGGDNDRAVEFPRLRTLTLDEVNAHSFCSRQERAIHLPLLEDLSFYKLSFLKVFSAGPIIAPKLKKVTLFHCEEMRNFLSGNSSWVVELPSLQSIDIHQAPFMHSFSTRPLKAPNLIHVKLYYCKDMYWFLPGCPDHGDVLELPSLRSVEIYKCVLRSFSSGPLKAPKLIHIEFDHEDYSIQEIGHDLNKFLQGSQDNSSQASEEESAYEAFEELVDTFFNDLYEVGERIDNKEIQEERSIYLT